MDNRYSTYIVTHYPRYRRIVDEGSEMPDLIFIDYGGKGQLPSAVEVLQTLGIADQSILGLAKRLEKVFMPSLSDPQNIPKSSPSMYLLQRVRDEAHRFAVSFQRSLRKKRMVHSELDDIPGINQKLAQIIQASLKNRNRVNKIIIPV